jgi:hypothetical protein
VHLERFIEQASTLFEPAGGCFVEGVEPVDEGAAGVVELHPLEPTQVCGAAALKVGVVAQAWRRGRQGAIGACVHRGRLS